VALRRDSGSCAHAPDVLAKGMAGVAAIPDHSRRYTRQLLQQWDGMGQFMCLLRREPKRDGVASSVSDHASLGAIASTRAAKCFTIISLSLGSPFRLAPAALWWARTLVPSRNTIPSSTPHS